MTDVINHELRQQRRARLGLETKSALVKEMLECHRRLDRIREELNHPLPEAHRVYVTESERIDSALLASMVEPLLEVFVDAEYALSTGDSTRLRESVGRFR